MRPGIGIAAIAALGLVFTPGVALSQMGGTPEGAVIEDELATPPANELEREDEDAPAEPGLAPAPPEDAARMNPYGDAETEEEAE